MRVEVLGDEVDAGVDGDAAEHDEGGETALVEGEVAYAEGQEQSDEGDRNHEDDSQGEAQGVEVDGADDEYQRNDQQDHCCIFFLIVIKPSSTTSVSLEADRKNFLIHIVYGLFNEF